MENRTVTFRYHKPGNTRWRTLALEVMEFMRRFLQHVLPTGFMKIRYYGFISAASKVLLERISSLIQLTHSFDLSLPETDSQSPTPMVCPECGGTVKLLFVALPYVYNYFMMSV